MKIDALQNYNDNGFDAFSVMVKMKGEKDFSDAKVYTLDALIEKDGHFNPYNL